MDDIDADDDSWLDDYEEGSTTEEFIHRMKNGMLLFDADVSSEEIARQVVEEFGLDQKNQCEGT